MKLNSQNRFDEFDIVYIHFPFDSDIVCVFIFIWIVNLSRSRHISIYILDAVTTHEMHSLAYDAHMTFA